jgi:hypothetical protein
MVCTDDDEDALEIIGHFGLCPSFGILREQKHNVSESGYVSVLSLENRHLLCWVLKK